MEDLKEINSPTYSSSRFSSFRPHYCTSTVHCSVIRWNSKVERGFSLTSANLQTKNPKVSKRSNENPFFKEALPTKNPKKSKKIQRKTPFQEGTFIFSLETLTKNPFDFQRKTLSSNEKPRVPTKT